MNHESAVYKVLSQPIVPPLNMGDKLSPMNNSNHPTLTSKQAVALSEAVELMRHDLERLMPLVEILKNCNIEHKPFLLSIGQLHSYIYVIDVTLELPKNKAVANWAYSRMGGAK